MEEVEVVISVICVVCGLGRLTEDRCSTKMNSVLDMSFIVDSCVRKHAKIYGENRQPCFKVYYFIEHSSDVSRKNKVTDNFNKQRYRQNKN